ncbi:hypothetical protein HNV09_005920 [Oceanispirochaeta sp. M2]|nr:hypothetical protein [Oceanispirochaeta sp. M2]NPD71604.1 hypothetical protein [Oceanispirochaeta sp. M1]RDG33171.1 hypothetical protein DV872_05770 [Oceanispirochaeta sp. M1]
MVRNSLKSVSCKDRKETAKYLKAIDSSITLDEAERELNNFAEK